MAVGPQDLLDQRLVMKYANVQVNNLQGIIHQSTMVEPEKMMSAMNDYASVSKTTFALSNKIQNICSKLNATVKYQPITRVAYT